MCSKRVTLGDPGGIASTFSFVNSHLFSSVVVGTLHISQNNSGLRFSKGAKVSRWLDLDFEPLMNSDTRSSSGLSGSRAKASFLARVSTVDFEITPCLSKDVRTCP